MRGKEHIAQGVEEWTFPRCGAHHDRDINAVKNILSA
ncbi:zinc ribbon domain-containing protein [Lactiplantibacillus sp. DA1]|nr:zinc ribbon domain-containing protein [Lactiplantibacillus sp. DA1]MDV0431341.1 zinc ribbon domain-containing protein [Lactiplantibacillus sp. DA1]